MKGRVGMDKLKLGAVADIYSGIVLKRYEQPKEALKDSYNKDKSEKEYFYITLKSVDDNRINLDLLERTHFKRRMDDKYILRRGDIVMKLSPPYSAAAVDFTREDVVAQSNFAIIKVKKDFKPEYLAFVLNSRYTKKQLIRLLEGSVLVIIRINYLNQLRIKPRDIGQQMKYAKLLSLLLRRKELKKRELELEELIMEYILSNL
jgi:restriction endonuclease S subunit